jgi:hypothetical protein
MHTILFRILAIVFWFIMFSSCNKGDKEVYLDQMDLKDIHMGWPIPPHINKTVKGTPLTVAGTEYTRGVWMNATCRIPIVLNENGVRFQALCGADDITLGSYKAVMEFLVVADYDTLFRSGPVSAGMEAKEVDVDLSGTDTLWLILSSYDGNVGNDQGDWLNAKISYKGDQTPFVYYAPSDNNADMPFPDNGYDAFHPGKSWYDTEGNKIQAHGGGIMKVDETYYWYGEHKGGETTYWPKARVDVIGVSCYSSKDLYNWKYEGLALPATQNDTTSPLHPSNVLERPKVVYNPNTNKYVMWVKSEDTGYTWGYAMRAVSDSPAGPFEFVKNNRPDDKKFGDFALYTEGQKGYLIWAWGEEETIMIYELTDDYLDVKKNIAQLYPHQKREAPAIIKIDNRYLLITSGKSGWSPNPCWYAWSENLAGPWKDMGEFAVGEGKETTFRSQSTDIIIHNGSLIYLGDRWDQKDLGDSRYIWLPIEMEGVQIIVRKVDEWRY